MMRWKSGHLSNTGDVILKAGIAKQPRRWIHFLNPSGEKMEWSGDEDERLMDRAKPQGPTDRERVAVEVGRTPSECVERHEKLLDAACARDGSKDPSDDLGRPRQGEQQGTERDADSRPARLDPADMAMIRMVAEMRAHCALTWGTKATSHVAEEYWRTEGSWNPRGAAEEEEGKKS